MTNSEPYVMVPDCQTVMTTQRALLVESDHFPEEERNPHGLDRRLYVHLAVLHPNVPMPPPKPGTGSLVVLKRFVDVHDINTYSVLDEEFFEDYEDNDT